MRGITAFSVVIILSGCAISPQQNKNDFIYNESSDESGILVSASSFKSGKSFEVSAVCTADDRHYEIRQTSTSIYGGDGAKWSVNINGNRYWTSESEYNDDSFLKAISSLEIVSPPDLLGTQTTIIVANKQMMSLVDLCRLKSTKLQIEEKANLSSEQQESDRAVKEVVNRTGALPITYGRNQIDFNNLVLLIQRDGPAHFINKFFWANDGDYIVSQVLKDRLILTSSTNPIYFLPITIITTETAIEGQPWSTISHGPLQFIGLSQYTSVLGAIRQTLLLRKI